MKNSLILCALCLVLTELAFTNAESDSRGLLHRLEQKHGGKYFSTNEAETTGKITTIESSTNETYALNAQPKNETELIEDMQMEEENSGLFSHPVTILGFLVILFMAMVIVGCAVFYFLSGRVNSDAYVQNLLNSS